MEAEPAAVGAAQGDKEVQKFFFRHEDLRRILLQAADQHNVAMAWDARSAEKEKKQLTEKFTAQLKEKEAEVKRLKERVEELEKKLPVDPARAEEDFKRLRKDLQEALTARMVAESTLHTTHRQAEELYHRLIAAENATASVQQENALLQEKLAHLQEENTTMRIEAGCSARAAELTAARAHEKQHLRGELAARLAEHAAQRVAEGIVPGTSCQRHGLKDLLRSAEAVADAAASPSRLENDGVVSFRDRLHSRRTVVPAANALLLPTPRAPRDAPRTCHCVHKVIDLA